MAEKEIILELDYRISPEDFYTFSVRSMNRQYAARAKKTNFTGILKLLVGILVLGYVIYARQTAMIQSPLMNEVVLWGVLFLLLPVDLPLSGEEVCPQRLQELLVPPESHQTAVLLHRL